MSEPSLFEIAAPADAPTYRGWRVWYDFGLYQHGIVYRETKFRAQSPEGVLIENPSPGPGEKPVDGHAWVRAEIDRLEEELTR